MKYILSLALFVFITLNSVLGATYGKVSQLNVAKSAKTSSTIKSNPNTKTLSASVWVDEKNDFLSFENDDDDFVIGRKYLLLTGGFFCLGFLPKLFDFHLCLNSDIIPTVNFTFLSSFKYILIRTLRI